jgi:hypothetical protein
MMENGKMTKVMAKVYRYLHRYDGEWKDDKKHGKGVHVFAGRRYEGEFKDNIREGEGIFTSQNGDRYDGEWKDGRRHGRGVLIEVGRELLESGELAHTLTINSNLQLINFCDQ